MGQVSKRNLEKEDRREKRKVEILEAAEALFQAQGIRTTKMIDIAKACELGKSTLYFYFKSKDEIIWNLLKKYSFSEHTAGIDYVNQLGGRGYDKLERYFSLFTDELIDSYDVKSPSYQYREYMSSIMVENHLTDEMKVEFKEMIKRNMLSLIMMVQEGINDGSVKPDLDPIDTGNAIGTAFGAYFRYAIGLKASFDDEFMSEIKEGLKVFTMLMLSSLKS